MGMGLDAMRLGRCKDHNYGLDNSWQYHTSTTVQVRMSGGCCLESQLSTATYDPVISLLGMGSMAVSLPADSVFVGRKGQNDVTVRDLKPDPVGLASHQDNPRSRKGGGYISPV